MWLQCFERQNSYLEDDAVFYWQPLEVNLGRSHVLVLPFSEHDAEERILNSLKLGQVN